ncbi:PAS domain-containing sensor histidine kinase [Bacteroides sp. 519]|uniref:sensor histidine kinase n=1 Tax=Bacteroides sp. 519 TaxID=2302937 RepID=UPI0013D09AC0|nr:ATP-binding protein [Bacteroides sp. 519]NDV59572.1 GHKL domain-containing protein [Bacteroides sp. 519]
MKYYSISIFIHILLISILSIGIYILIEKELWFSTLVLILLLIVTGINLYVMQRRHIYMMQRLIESIRFNDLTQSFPVSIKNKMMRELATELSGAMRNLKQRVLEEEIKHQYYENLLNKVDTAVLVADASGRIEWMNKSASMLLPNRLNVPETILNNLSDTQTINLEKNGQVQEMAVSSTVFLAQGKEQMLISLKDIHAVLEKNEMEAWQKLIRVLTHEIMNSITPIISLAETLSERDIQFPVQEKDYKIMHQAMQTIHRRSRGLLDFVENYRRLTRLPAPVLKKVVVKELFSDIRKLFPDHAIVFNIKNPETTLVVDRSQIEQVLINLIKNAREAVEGKQTASIIIESETKTVENKTVISIKDNGEGILPDVLDKVFVPFFTTKKTGSGIGLSLCKQIMNLHKGTISVISKSGEGSCFILGLPL